MEIKWAYTLIIPAGCKVQDDRRYRDLSGAEQVAYLQNIMKLNFNEKDFTINHEQHKDGRFHIHGEITALEFDIQMTQYSINKYLGYALTNKRIFYYKKDPDRNWIVYCKKDILKHCALPESDDEDTSLT